MEITETVLRRFALSVNELEQGGFVGAGKEAFAALENSGFDFGFEVSPERSGSVFWAFKYLAEALLGEALPDLRSPPNNGLSRNPASAARSVLPQIISTLSGLEDFNGPVFFDAVTARSVPCPFKPNWKSSDFEREIKRVLELTGSKVLEDLLNQKIEASSFSLGKSWFQDAGGRSLRGRKNNAGVKGEDGEVKSLDQALAENIATAIELVNEKGLSWRDVPKILNGRARHSGVGRSNWDAKDLSRRVGILIGRGYKFEPTKDRDWHKRWEKNQAKKEAKKKSPLLSGQDLPEGLTTYTRPWFINAENIKFAVDTVGNRRDDVIDFLNSENVRVRKKGSASAKFNPKTLASVKKMTTQHGFEIPLLIT
ncbi:hypothetical protein [uncultured Roseibium sp.]|uniref:hypothetical protein n=1 Tax=uncultured Roseibium sp. TaxID=1936171 RepID=UPI002616361F|nr:hypothetical protein [uncultured Roseibium sp.]